MQPGDDVIDFEINLIFLMKPIFLKDKNSKTKINMSCERKKLLMWNK